MLFMFITEFPGNMLHYTHGSLNVPALQNSGNLFVHRLANDNPERNKDTILSSYTSASSFSSNTYWKSPNAVESTAFPQNGICLPPEMTVTSKFGNRPKSSIRSTEVKGILKNKDTAVRDMKFDIDNITPRSSYLNFIDEGSGDKTKLVGSSTKRVQFDRLPNQQESTKKPEKSSKQASTESQSINKEVKIETAKPVIKPNMYEVKRVPFAGIYMFRKEHSAHSLNRKHLQTNNDVNNRSQITAFIKKLRLVENAKVKRVEENMRHMEKLDKEIGKLSEKLRRPRVKSAMFKSTEGGQSAGEQNKPKTGDERLKSAAKDGRANDNSTNDTSVDDRLKPKTDFKHDETGLSKDLVPTNSFLLGRTGSGYLDKLKRQRAFSAYTRYNSAKPSYMKLWKPGESNCYKDEHVRRSNLSNTSKQTLVTNYCDSGKTSQILGWLSDVTAARSDKPGLPALECISQSLVTEDLNAVASDIESIDKCFLDT